MVSTAFRLTEMELRHDALAAGGTPLTLVHLSDLHLRRWGREHEELARMVNGWDADFVFVTGDFLSRLPESLELTGRLVRQLRSRYGSFLCRGNWEVVWGPPLRRLKSRVQSWGAELLSNQSRLFHTRAGRVQVGGIDDLWRGAPDLEAACRPAEGGADLTILLSHAPLAATLLAPGHHVDVVLSGHTHGGQVRVPWLWRLFLPPGHGGFTDGWHEVNGVRLCVSRGFGTGGPLPFRFRCPAEVALFRVRGG